MNCCISSGWFPDVWWQNPPRLMVQALIFVAYFRHIPTKSPCCQLILPTNHQTFYRTVILVHIYTYLHIYIYISLSLSLTFFIYFFRRLRWRLDEPIWSPKSPHSQGSNDLVWAIRSEEDQHHWDEGRIARTPRTPWTELLWDCRWWFQKPDLPR